MSLDIEQLRATKNNRTAWKAVMGPKFLEDPSRRVSHGHGHHMAGAGGRTRRGAGVSADPGGRRRVSRCDANERKLTWARAPRKGQHYRLTGLNLLAAIIIYWNTRKLGEAVFTRKNAGLDIPAEFLAHVSPLGWEHINLTGEYRWPRAGPRST